jgi:hypothetical protein
METQMAEALFQVPSEAAITPEPQPPTPHTEPAKVEAAPTAELEPVTEPVTETPVFVALPEPPETAQHKADRLHQEQARAQIRAFEERVRNANKTEEKPHVPQPVAPGILQQTSDEMEMGRKMNAHHAAQKANRPTVKLSAQEIAAAGSQNPVFRPADGAGSKEENKAQFKSQSPTS